MKPLRTAAVAVSCALVLALFTLTSRAQQKIYWGDEVPAMTIAGAAGAHRSRHVPAAVKRAVWTRDSGRCAFVGSQGRCAETGFLEFHHVVPFAEGGATNVGNLELRCRAHNAYEAGIRPASGSAGFG